ncbi:DUF6438 domain-containing protein [Sphingomonas sp. G-3-2-10]|uniref:DUF6438 domain-containing protein n=1 Tax=Sphingomonas sp. G-3-2-10 TaxID=2728838 RepID=UPI00146DFE0B|nr:DUF6438 domain-containing protein [Sphingomonas sp. G-3-2-10]NML07430.1 hypothetical protein [Sphingomonas sp. G-3-2-10]
MRWMIVSVAALALAGCARTDGGRPIPIESDSITYETGPCFGRCPVYSITLRPDGSGVFTGKNFTAVAGERAFKLTPAEYQAFAGRLQPYRPESGERRYSHGEKGCEQAVTDMPSVDIRWTRAIGDSQSLYFYYGCVGEKNRAMADALGSATDDIPALEALIGERP